jgi:O-antigen/teichoic acid export membrane protein
MFELLVVLTAFPLCVVMVAGPALCAVVLGAPWREAGVYAQLLVPWVVMMALASPLYAILLATQRLAETLAYNVVLLAARVAALLVGGLLGGPRSAVALYVVVSVVLVGWTVARTLFVAEVSRRWAARLMIRSYGESLLLLLPAGLLSFYGRPVWAMGALGLASVAEIVILWVRFPRARNVVRVMVVRARAPFTAQGSAK